MIRSQECTFQPRMQTFMVSALLRISPAIKTKMAAWSTFPTSSRAREFQVTLQ